MNILNLQRSEYNFNIDIFNPKLNGYQWTAFNNRIGKLPLLPYRCIGCCLGCIVITFTYLCVVKSITRGGDIQ